MCSLAFVVAQLARIAPSPKPRPTLRSSSPPPAPRPRTRCISASLLWRNRINIGNNLQATGLANPAPDGRKAFVWKIGVTIFAISSIVNFGAFGFAPAAVLAPLEAVQFVSNLAYARFVNHQPITYTMYSGSGFIIGGVVLAIYVFPADVAKFTVDELLDCWKDATWLVYLSGIVGCGVGFHEAERPPTVPLSAGPRGGRPPVPVNRGCVCGVRPPWAMRVSLHPQRAVSLHTLLAQKCIECCSVSTL